jgi:pentatricopeptide repeat protein
LLVTKILHNQYPFTDVHHTKSILNSILRLQKESIAIENGLDYRVDFGTLEYVTYAAAKRKSTDLILLVWDIVEMLEYTPSESMYENTIQSFVMSKRQDHKAFAVLADMEQKGFVPSRALLSTMNRSIRVTERRVDNAMRILKDETPGTKISVNSLNCILSAYASNGLVDKAFETYDSFTDYEIIPNSDTFAYLMESLSVDANTLIPLNINDIMGKWEKEMDTIKDVQKDNDYIEWKSSRLMAADVILLTIEDKKIVKNEHIIHEYIRLLCAFKETEKAKDFITGILNSQEVGLGEDQMILLETFVILSSSCALNGQMESALEVVELSRRFGYCNGLPEYAMCRLNQLKTEAE